MELYLRCLFCSRIEYLWSDAVSPDAAQCTVSNICLRRETPKSDIILLSTIEALVNRRVRLRIKHVYLLMHAQEYSRQKNRSRLRF